MKPICLSLIGLLCIISQLSGCSGGSSGSPPPPSGPATPSVTVAPGAATITTAQSLSVNIAVSGSKGTPTGSVVLSSGAYTSLATPLSSGSAAITVPAGSLATGSDTLTAKYAPDSASSSIYNSASGTASVTVAAGKSTSVAVSIDALANRHTISPYVYGGNPSEGPAQATDLGMSLARFGGNASSDYNWQLHTYNSGSDYYFEDYGLGGAEPDSVQFITDYQNAGSHALTTMPMLEWVAQSAENGTNGHWSFSVKAFGAQCSVDPYNTDAGNGLVAGSTGNCSTSTAPVTSDAVTAAYYPLLDSSSDSCSTGSCVYREPWAQALASAFGSGTCAVPYSPIASCHFYDLDNEPEIWSGTHRDVHPTATGYDELADDFETEAANLKTWDPAAVRFGPVFSDWWFYWNGANSADKGNHGGVDFLPWWLNQIKWFDQINGSRTLDVLDVHAYPDANTSGLGTAQLQALAAGVYRDYWDPTYVSTSGTIDQEWTTSIQPDQTIPFRIPRLKALVNAIYPNTPLAFTEWSAAFYGESDFSTALGDADVYGIFGREGISFATRWGAPCSNRTTYCGHNSGVPNPNYLALKLYGNYDGAHGGFGTVSISDTNNGNVNLFSSYAALNSTGTKMTIVVINKDPNNAAQVTFNLSGFNASSYVAYSISSTADSAISVSSSEPWSATQTFTPYSITLLVVDGNETSAPASEWYLNPDDLMVPASSAATLHPAISSGSATVTLSSAVFDAYEGVPACAGSLTLTNATIAPSTPGTITVDNAATTGQAKTSVQTGSPAGFCHYTVTGSDGTATQTQGGWIVVGNPPATLAISSGNNQTGSAGTVLSSSLSVTLSPGSSGGSANGAGILFTTSAGTLSNGTTSGTSVIAMTNSSGTASVTLTLPSATGNVTVTAQDQFALGGASVTFTETAN